MNPLILDMQRKVIGGYMNVAEKGVCKDAALIQSHELTEELFDLVFHKAIVRAMNHLKAKGIEVSDYTVLDFLQSYGLPKTVQDEQEFSLLQTEFMITNRSFNAYLESIKLNRAKRVTL